MHIYSNCTVYSLHTTAKYTASDSMSMPTEKQWYAEIFKLFEVETKVTHRRI